MRLFALVLLVATASCVPNNSQSNSGSGGAPPSSGGVTTSGGAPSSGGKPSSGGMISSGGAPSSGGKVSTGGAPSSGGKVSTGGSTSTASVDCPDVSTYTAVVNSNFGGSYISVDGNANKNYYMQANWWGLYSNEVEMINGLGFSMTNPTGVSSSNNNPMGFPSIYIGSYSGKPTKGSNLPKQVSALTGVPTIFSTNSDSKGTSNYNATYDVWFSQSSGGVSGSDPGSGGAYLMVWLFKPSNRQPRGSIAVNGRMINGMPGAWDVWIDNTNPPCISYVVSGAPLAQLSFDLNDFIQDAVTNKYGITASMYLSIVFAGFEVWGGGDGLQIKKFCATVQ
jgi:hypothetical protein